MADPFANFSINKPLVQKWMKKASAQTRKLKIRQMALGEEPSSPVTPGSSRLPQSKSRAEDMYDGRRLYVMGYIEQASSREMNRLRANVAGSSPRGSNSKLIYELLDTYSNTRSAKTQGRSKGFILSILSAYNANNVKSPLVRILYDAMPSKY